MNGDMSFNVRRFNMNDSPNKTQSKGKACHFVASLIECTAQDGLRGC